MYYKLNETELTKIKVVSEITYSDYELLGDFIPVENLMFAIEDLLIELDNKEEKIRDLERDRDENYTLREINPYTEYGVSEKDFI